MTSTFWPMSQTGPTCTLPEPLIRSCQSFQQFYLSRHSGRRLTWQHSMGNADVRVSFDKRKHDLNVSTFALVILMLFENLHHGEFLTYEVRLTRIMRHLFSFVDAGSSCRKLNQPHQSSTVNCNATCSHLPALNTRF